MRFSCHCPLDGCREWEKLQGRSWRNSESRRSRIYDHLRPHASEVKVAHPLMLRAIAAAKKKNDKVDASKIADCLRCDFLPECYMASTEIRDRRRTLRYRHLLVRQMVQTEEPCVRPADGNRSEPQQAAAPQGGLFPRFDREQREHRREYPAASSTEPGYDHATRKTESALVRSLQPDPLLTVRIKRLKTVPGVGPITALTWALEMGDISRFRSIRQAISYCGLCGDEKRSAEKVMRTPLSQQRNKHIQSCLVEAAKLAPRYDHDLALLYENEKKKGNANRATLAVARKMVAYLMAVDREQRDFVPEQSAAGRRPKNRASEEKNIRITKRAGCQVLHLTE